MDWGAITPGIFALLGAVIGAASPHLGPLIQLRHKRRDERREELRDLMRAIQRYLRAAGRINHHDTRHPGTLLPDDLNGESFEAMVDLRLKAFLAGQGIGEETLRLLDVRTGTGYTDSDLLRLSSAVNALQVRIGQEYASL